MNDLTHIDLFSGIGGFALAARWAGINTVQFVELDPFCRKVLNKNFPGVPIHDDIKTFTNTEGINNQEQERPIISDREIITGREKDIRIKFRGFDDIAQRPFLLTGGFPCQPFSCAGKRKGTEDDRHLWPEMLRVIKEFKPTWIIGENVAGIRSMELVNSDSAVESNPDIQEDGENDYTTVLDGICNDLEGIGYEVQPIIIPACAVGAPHRRDRVWFVAHAIMCEHGTGRRQIRETDGIQGINRSALRSGRIERTDSDAPDSNSERLQRESVNLRSEGKKSNDGQSGRCGGEWQENWLEVATRLCRVDDGLPRQVDRVNRLKALGNSIVPQVAYEIMKSILKVENES